MGEKVQKAEKPHYEFFGPPGAFAITFLLPLLVYTFYFVCNDVSGCPAPSLLHPSSFDFGQFKQEVGWYGWSTLLNTKAFIAVLGWYFVSLFLWAFLPTTEIEGVELDSGGKLKYRFNTFQTNCVILSVLAAGTFLQGADFPVWTFIWDNYIPIITSNLLIAYGVSAFVYVRSFQVRRGNKDLRELAKGGKTGNMLYDFFIGRELNPRVTIPGFGDVDIKSFFEVRPGLLGWMVLDLANCAHQYKAYGRVTPSILLITFAQSLYVMDCAYMEPAILTTIDIIADGFGFMLGFGDVVWVPFVYSIQTRYLAVHPKELSYLQIAAIVGIQAGGFYIFRSVNNEKNRFRTNPKDPRIAHLKYMETKAGSKLLISGWWGTARHINYLGDWFMSWSFCLPTGLAGYIIKRSTLPDSEDGQFAHIVPGEAAGWGMLITYFYMLYFGILLVHRERRDEEKCRKKYGEDWDKYVKLVPWRIIPGIY